MCRTKHVSDTAPYAIGREIEDVVLVVEAFSGPVHLLGHSYGAILALEAAVSTNNLRTLTLFEPPIGWGELTPLLTRIDVLLDEGDREAATALIMREIAGLSDDALAELRTVPEAWQPMVACAHTFTREARSVAAFSFDAARYTNQPQRADRPARRAESPANFGIGIGLVWEAIAGARLVTMPGVDHKAITKGPTGPC